jgi:hypothetical protein
MQGLSGSAKAFAVNLPGHPDGEVTCKSVSDYVEALHQFIVRDPHRPQEQPRSGQPGFFVARGAALIHTGLQPGVQGAGWV